MKSKTLTNQINNFEFHPEVYVYPTPRMYEPVSNFSLGDVDFTKEINVYIHIPFCKQICSYCGYLKVVDSKENLKGQYVNALIKEMKMYREIFSRSLLLSIVNLETSFSILIKGCSFV